MDNMYKQKKFKKVNRIRENKDKALGNRGFTMMEIIIVVAILSIIMGLAAVGMNGYFETSEQIKRSEVAETAYYSLQSQINYLKRNGKLEDFEQQLRDYNVSVYGEERILTTDQNRTIVISNYDGENAETFYDDEYYPAHTGSEIIYVTLDKMLDDNSANPIYGILQKALQDDETVENSFLVEYDLTTGVVRSVFYSEYADALHYTFADLDGAKKDRSDCIMREAKQLSDKKQGYYGVMFTSREYDEVVKQLNTPDAVKLVNGDRLYLTWQEANTDNPCFVDGTYRIEALSYVITLYNQDNQVIAVYDMPRADMYQDITGTESGLLDYLDDYADTVEDTVEGSTKTARIGYADLSYEEAPDGIAGEYYYMLLECLDHPFDENGYEFDGADTIYATLEVICGEDGNMRSETSPISNVESVYYASVENEVGNEEFGISCSRHLWNIRKGKYNGRYRLIADVDWSNIENRGRDFNYTAITFADKEVAGVVHSFEGTFQGGRTGENATPGKEFDCYQIHGIRQNEADSEQVGLFAVNRGTIYNIMLSDYQVIGAVDVGTMAGINQGTIYGVCVLDASVEAQYQAGGLVGTSQGAILNCVVTTGENKIRAQHSMGGIVGVLSGSITESAAACKVETIIPEETISLFSNGIGRYAGGVVGCARSGATASYLYSGVLLGNDGLPLSMKENQVSGQPLEGTTASTVTAMGYMGGVVGEIQSGAGNFNHLYNYADMQIEYISPEEKTERGDGVTKAYMYRYYGGITGHLYAESTLESCENFVPVEAVFVQDGEPVDAATVAAYIVRGNGYYWNDINNPTYIGGIAGYNDGIVTDCLSACKEYGTFAEELDAEVARLNGAEACNVGYYAGGIVGFNNGQVKFTDKLGSHDMEVVVHSYITAGGIIGYQAAEGSLLNETGEHLTVHGLVAATQDYAAGVTGYFAGGTLSGKYNNACNVYGQYAAGITTMLRAGMVLDDCNNSGTIAGRGVGSTTPRGYMGGIVGYNLGTIQNCTNNGTVTSYYYNGLPDTIITFSYGDMGGIVGCNAGMVANCHMKSNADKSNYLAGNHYCVIGGIVGRNVYNGTSTFGVISNDSEEEIVDVPIMVGADTDKNGNYATKVGGIVGYAEGQLALNNYTYTGVITHNNTNMNDAAIGIGGIAGFWQVNQTMTGCTMKGSIVSKNKNTGGLIGYMYGGIVDETNQVTEQASITAVNNVGGVVGCYSTTDTAARMLVKTNVSTVNGSNFVGGLAGYVGSKSYLDLSDCSNSGKITGSAYVGGLLGCLASSEVTSFEGTENRGVISGKSSVGGIIGRLGASTEVFRFSNVYNRGQIYQNAAGSSYHGGIIGDTAAKVHMERCLNVNTILPLDDSCKGAYVGGMVGVATESGEFYWCENGSELQGTSYVGGILGRGTKTAGSYLAEGCINQIGGKIMATSNYAGGMFGYVSVAAASTADAPGEITVSNCHNRGNIDAPFYVGGMIGAISNSHFQIQYSHNYGVIGEYAEGRWTTQMAGGILGYASNYYTEESLIFDCSQNADMKNIRTYSGGIVGAVYENINIRYCFTARDSECTISTGQIAAYCIGGIVGYVPSGHTLSIQQTTNRANIEAADTITHVGGFVGYTTGSCYIGAEGDGTASCYNYGNIDGASSVSSAGGFIGSSENSPEVLLYASDNYGNIGQNATAMSYGGGLIGRISLAQQKEGRILVQNCTQYGSLYSAGSFVGGLIGYHGWHDLTMDNCKNGDATKEDAGKIFIKAANSLYIGGLIGYSGDNLSGDRTKHITASHNYGDIYAQTESGKATYVGGLIGYDRMVTILGEEGNPAKACNNYGDIDGVSSASLEGAGGLVGATAAPSLVNAHIRIYNSTNEGNIGENVSKITCSGGIIGDVYGYCDLYSCTQKGVLYNAQTAVGGLAGRLRKYDMLIENCTNGAEDAQESGDIVISAATSNQIGGFVGIATENALIDDVPTQLTIVSGENYGDIRIENPSSTATGNDMGGFIGYALYKTVIGDAEDDTLGCYNYGNIDGMENNILYQAGGIIGRAVPNGTVTDTIEIYSTINEGNIGEHVGSLRHGAGIIGYSKSGGILKECTNLGQLYHLDQYMDGNRGSGGIAGCVSSTTEFLILSCTNGSKQDASAGKLVGNAISGKTGAAGGILGAASYADVTNCVVTIKDCVNYAPMEFYGETNYVGGICGRQSSSSSTLTLEGCVNHGDIIFDGHQVNYIGGLLGYGEGNSLIIGGVKADGTTDEALVCTNLGELLFVNGCHGDVLGGYVGVAKNAQIYGAVNTISIAPDENSLISGVGGIAGRIMGTSLLQDCVQRGSICDVVYNTLGVTAGGIVARLDGTASLIRCSNGTEADRAEGSSNTAGQITAKYWADGNQYVDTIGGIVGVSLAQMTLTDCNNYGDILLEEKAQSVGGIVGKSYLEDTYLACANYGDILCEGRLYYAGGIIGYAVGNTSYTKVLTMGDVNDAAKGCVNYGNIRVGGEEVSSGLGGMIGWSNRPSKLYACVNEGDIEGSETDGYVVNAGGMIGRLQEYNSTEDNILVDCVQLGDIRRIYYHGYNASNGDSPGGTGISGVGGMIGGVWVKTDFINCTSGSSDPAAKNVLECLDHAESVGGIVGIGSYITMLSCKNYMDILGEGKVWYIGGLGGWFSGVIGDSEDASRACINYGNIGAEGNEVRMGGLVGYSGSTFAVYYGQNMGDVGFGKTSANSVGGIVGFVYSSDTAIVGAVNEGNVLTAMAPLDTASAVSVGGIAGQYRQPNSSSSLVYNQDISKVLLDKCVNRGNIGTEGVNIKGSSIGGIAGSANGTVRDCTNLGNVYVGNSTVGGVLGAVYGEAVKCIVVGCVNGSDTEPEAGQIRLSGQVSYIGGVIGYCTTHNYSLHLQISDCVNYGTVDLEAGYANGYIGGIIGRRYLSSSASSKMEITNCENYGSLNNGYYYVGGIVGTLDAQGTYYMLAGCANYGTINMQNKIEGSVATYAYVGGISGSMINQGGVIHCLNAGTINSGSAVYVGGLTGYLGSAAGSYMMDCYQLGDVSNAFATATKQSYYLFDCYAYGAFSSGLIGSDSAAGTTAKVWQAKDDSLGDGYFSRSVFEQLCTKFGLDADRWSDGDMAANVKYLMSAYKYEATAPEGSNYVFTPADPEVANSVNTITWDISDTNYLSANGMEIALYPMDMTDEEILADTDGANAYLKLTAAFTSTIIPASAKVTVAEEYLPEEDTEYRIVLRTLGYSIVSFNSDADSEPEVIQITGDSPRILENETIVLTAKSVESIMMLSEEDMSDSVSGGNGAVSDGNMSSTVSGGNMKSAVSDGNGQTN